MTTYKKESHLRSLIKGISWRIVATCDTILIVLLITCLTGHCNLDNALKIGALEFLLKFIIYYLHERIWQRALKNGTLPSKNILYKTVSWRIVATSMTFVITGTILNAFNEVVLYIALVELVTKFVLYYLHERMWLKLPLGRIRNFFFPRKD